MSRTTRMVDDYVGALSDDELKYLNSRYSQKLAGDWADIAHVLSRDREIDRWLHSANGPHPWFEMVDLVGESVEDEYIYRTDKAEVKKHANRK